MKNYFDELVAAILKAVAFESVQEAPEEGAPFGRKNREVLDWALDLAESFGAKSVNLDGYCGYSDVGEGEEFGILGHLDVVPIGKGWTKNPLGEISDGVLYGRGVMDDKGPMLAVLFAVKQLLDEGNVLKKKLRFIWGCNEESGWKCIEHYNKCERMPDVGISPDADFPVINCEKGILHVTLKKQVRSAVEIKAGERPNVVPNECRVSAKATAKLLNALANAGVKYEISGDTATFTVYGTAAHASTPWLGDNAIVKALGLPYDDAEISALYGKLNDYYGAGCGLTLSDEVSGKLTLNTGIISLQGGELSFTIDVRHPATLSSDIVLGILGKQFGDFDVTVDENQHPLYVERDNPLVQSLLAAYNAATGENAEPITIGGGTYARALKTGVAFGPLLPGREGTIHMPDECVSLADLRTIYDIYYKALKRLCF